MICVIGEITNLSIAVYADWPAFFNRKNHQSGALHFEETILV
jgi:hypothetical protein